MADIAEPTPADQPPAGSQVDRSEQPEPIAATQPSSGGSRRGQVKRPSRTRTRRRAFEVIFEALQRGEDLLQVAAERDLPPYGLELVQGVAANRVAIAEWLDTYSDGWPTERMPAVDLAVLHLGAFEVVFEDDVPDAVILKDCADLVGELSTDKSPGFVSGLLGRLSNIKTTLR